MGLQAELSCPFLDEFCLRSTIGTVRLRFDRFRTTLFPHHTSCLWGAGYYQEWPLGCGDPGVSVEFLSSGALSNGRNNHRAVSLLWPSPFERLDPLLLVYPWVLFMERTVLNQIVAHRLWGVEWGVMFFALTKIQNT